MTAVRVVICFVAALVDGGCGSRWGAPAGGFALLPRVIASGDV